MEESQSYTGTVKGFSINSGYGFIESPQMKSFYGKDILFLKTSLGGFSVKKGDQVSFSLSQTDKGPNAINLQVLSDAPSYMGEIKSFNPQKGWGIITCEATEKAYGKDVFLLKSSCSNGYTAAAGDLIIFSVEETSRGPQAKDVKPAKPSNGQKTPAIVRGCATVPPSQDVPGLGQVFQGTVKSYNAQKGWGMIDCPQTRELYGKDMFVLRTSLMFDSVNAGESVQFTVALGQKGPEAFNVKPVNGGSANSAPKPTQARSGLPKGRGRASPY
eukprot:TRINITY_DN26728_c0_g1_i1.p1 TRINITY_DN26728_c0_g1~~TRINITY_DN26728_c0_g1_i1.p1  ORF type:complete len:272 (+),score=35.89 TRINITY_DN26728_c0_g1_i1:106-921(+)